MSNISEKLRGKIYSSKGGWKIGEGVYSHGSNLLEELVGEISYFQLLLLNATGRLYSYEIGVWVEAIYGCMSWPDPRIWCNTIGALGGTSRCGVIPSVLAGTLASDSLIYGPKPASLCADMLVRLQQKIDEGAQLETIINEDLSKFGGKVNFPGFARPIAKGDERIQTMERVSRKLDFEEGKYLKLAYGVDRILTQNYNESMNIAGYVAGSMLDFGFNAEEITRVFAILVNSGVMACYLDTYNRPANTFLPLKCDDIDYIGKPYRRVIR